MYKEKGKKALDFLYVSCLSPGDEEEADETMASGQEDGVDRLFSVPSHAGQDDPDDD